MRLAWCCAFLLCLGSGVALATHGHWIDHYRGANNMLCCNATHDCRIVAARILSQEAGQSTVEVEGVVVTVPSLAVKVSEDSNAWYCARAVGEPISAENLRCLFLAIGG